MHVSVSSNQLQGKKIFINLPHLPQSTTKEREESIVTLNTPTGYATNEDTDYDEDTSSSEPSDTYKQHDYRLDEDESSSSSSDWEPSTSIASSYLPRDLRRTNNKSHLKPYASLRLDIDEGSELNTTNNTLFYPYSNLQSLLFSSSHCYIETDYKKIKNVNIIDEEDGNHLDNTEMDWTDKKSVQTLKELMHNLLVSSSLTIGIREEEIYLMFNSPSPQQIIQHLRFGLLSDLCDVHIDRFGRRSFYRKNTKHSSNNRTHFYNHSRIPSNIFAMNDINNLSNFVQESPRIYYSPFTESPSHIKTLSDKPVTYLLTKTKNNVNPNRTATHIASKHHKKKTNHKIKQSLSAFKCMDLLDIFMNEKMNDNYFIAKKIVEYFDGIFDDTDTVCLVSKLHKEPAISYWIKGQYVRKERYVLNNKYVLVYRSCKHVPAKKPMVSQRMFEEYVKDISVKYENESVDFIGEKLDNKFGVGCHYVRSTQKKGICDEYDIYCRFSDKYECSFKLNGNINNTYVIAWRR